MRTLITLLLFSLGYTSACAAASNKTVAIVAKPKFEQSGAFVDLVLGSSKRSHRVAWGTPWAELSTSILDTNRVYSFIVSRRQTSGSMFADDDFEDLELHSVWLEGKPVYDRKAPVFITSKPRFEQKDRSVELVISGSNRTCRVLWGTVAGFQFLPVPLDTNRAYGFTLAYRSHRYVTIPELTKVKLDDQTIYDIEVCEIHKTKMEHKEVPIAYGLVLPDRKEPSADEYRRLFPHHREYSFGGCVVTPDSPPTEMIYVCSDCKKAYGNWKLGR